MVAEPTPVPGVGGVVQLSAGGLHTCALLEGGRVLCWGANDEGQLGDGRLVHDGEACQLGSDVFDCTRAPVEVVGFDDAVQISAGAKHTCALRVTGDVVCWGWSADRQLGDGDQHFDPAPVTVEQRIREIKRAVRDDPGDRALRAERRALRALATLLCAVRAHARGNVHVGGSLEGQERYIRERTPAVRGAERVRQLMIERYETTLEEGQEITVEGVALRESVRDPDRARGYRDAPLRARWTPVAPPDDVVTVTGQGEAAPTRGPVAEERVRKRPPSEPSSPKAAGSPGLAIVDWAVPVGVAAVIALVVFALPRCH